MRDPREQEELDAEFNGAFDSVSERYAAELGNEGMQDEYQPCPNCGRSYHYTDKQCVECGQPLDVVSLNLYAATQAVLDGKKSKRITTKRNVRVSYSSIDHFRQTRGFKTLEGAQNFAQKWIGETPEIGTCYAISGDGIGRITVKGATLAELFPRCGAGKED
jgi:hypothetical protein